ncbi:hypothetical protein EHS39_29925 [Ensifer sp. MPMI2T]|nr:hypothetical protein EHS39_29925 [Ensifer sp. MPMI2T]
MARANTCPRAQKTPAGHKRARPTLPTKEPWNFAMMGHDAALAQYHYGITWDQMGVNGRSS